MKSIRTLNGLICLLIFICCAAQQPSKVIKKDNIIVPVGVDSSLAVVADSITNLCLIPETDKIEANKIYENVLHIIAISDSLWEYYLLLKDTSYSFTIIDSINTRRCIDKGSDYAKDFKNKLKQIQKLQKQEGLLSSQGIYHIVITLLEKSQSLLAYAKTLDPFNIDIRVKEIQLFEELAIRTQNNTYLQRASEDLKKLISFQKGEHDLYRWLAQMYFDLSQWEKAYQNFHQAQIVLERTSIFNITDPEILFNKRYLIPLDTTQLVGYLYKQAEAKVHLYDDSTSLALLNKALLLTRSQEEKEAIQSFISWINWDDGHIRASEIRDSLYTMEESKQYVKAKDGYIKLLEILKSESASDEIQWKIALIHYLQLDKKLDGAARLLKVIKKTPKNSSGRPFDSRYEVYFQDFGTMCYNLGVDYLEKNEDKKAYIYLSQAAAVDWSNRGSSYLKLAGLSTYNTRETLYKCMLALQCPLSQEEQQEAYRLLFEANMQIGNFKEAKQWFYKYRNIQ